MDEANYPILEWMLSYACLHSKYQNESHSFARLSEPGVPGVPWHHQILADPLTLSQPGGVDYAHLITTGPNGFLHPATALLYKVMYKTQIKSLKNLGCM